MDDNLADDMENGTFENEHNRANILESLPSIHNTLHQSEDSDMDEDQNEMGLDGLDSELSNKEDKICDLILVHLKEHKNHRIKEDWINKTALDLKLSVSTAKSLHGL